MPRHGADYLLLASSFSSTKDSANSLQVVQRLAGDVQNFGLDRAMACNCTAYYLANNTFLFASPS